MLMGSSQPNVFRSQGVSVNNPPIQARRPKEVDAVPDISYVHQDR